MVLFRFIARILSHVSTGVPLNLAFSSLSGTYPCLRSPCFAHLCSSSPLTFFLACFCCCDSFYLSHVLSIRFVLLILCSCPLQCSFTFPVLYRPDSFRLYICLVSFCCASIFNHVTSLECCYRLIQLEMRTVRLFKCNHLPKKIN